MMRRFIVALVVLFACFSLAYAGTKITEMTAIGSLELTDILEVVDDPGGSPLSRKATFQQVADVVSTDTDIADAISKKHTAGTDTALGAVGTKNPPIDDDLVLYRDSTSSDALVTSTWTQVKAFLKTYFDTQYDDYTLEAHKDTHDPEDGSDALDTAAAAEIAGVQAAGAGSSHSLARADHVHQIQHGITDNHIVTMDSADAADDEYARFTANGLEGRSIAEALSDLGVAAGADVTADNDPKAHATSHAVAGADTVFPADPGADRYLQWDDDPGQLVWAEGSGGDVTSVGDGLTGACLDGSSDGGTYIAMYDGDSNYTKITAGNSTADLTFTLPAAYPGASDYLLKSSDAGVLAYTDPATFQAASATLDSLAGLTETNGGIPYGTADNAYAWLAAGATGKVLIAKGAAAPEWTPYTFPATVPAVGKVLISDGTNLIGSTALGTAAYTATGDYQAAHAYLADIAGITANQGDIIYFDGSDWVDLAPGDSGKYLKTQGAGAAPVWDTPAGGEGGAPTDATYIVQTANGDLSAEQALGALATGILKNETTTGVLSIAAAGTDYVAVHAALTSITGLNEADASILECTADNTYSVVTSGGNSYILGSTSDNSAIEFKTPANAFAEIKQAATDAATGVVELATTAEIDAGSDTGRAMTPDAFNGSIHGLKRVILKITDDSTALTTGDGKLIITAPPEWNGMNIVDFDICISTASSSGAPEVALYNVTDSCDILSTNATIDATEYSSYTAATAPAIDTSHDDLATGDRLRIDIDGAGTGAKGLEIHIGMRKP